MWPSKDILGTVFVAAFCAIILGGFLFFIVTGPKRTKGALVQATVDRIQPGSVGPPKALWKYQVVLTNGTGRIALSGSLLPKGTAVCIREYVNTKTKHVDVYRVESVGRCPVE